MSLFVIWISFLPLLTFKGAFEGPKDFAFLLGSTVLLCWWLFYRLSKRKLHLTRSDLWHWLFILTLSVSSLIGGDFSVSFLGGSYRHQGVIFFIALWLIAKTTAVLAPRSKSLLYCLTSTALLTELVVVFGQFIFGRLYFGRPLGTLGNPNAVAGYFAVGVYFLLEFFKERKLPIYILFLMGIILTSSRSAILAFFFQLFRFFKNKKLVFILVFLLVTVAILFLIKRPASKFEDRILFWKIGLQEFIKRPVFGYGAESEDVLYDLAFRKMNIPLVGLNIDRSHNLLLDVGLWSGVFGLLAFGEFLFWTYKSLRNVGKKSAFWAFVVFSFFQPLSVVHWILFVVMVNI